MNGPLVWALDRARRQTLALVADVPAEHMCRQSTHGEHHPTWTLGHLLLSDTYLLFLLNVRPLSDDFSALLRKYGPGAAPTALVADYHAKDVLHDRLVDTGSLRAHAIQSMTAHDLAAPTPDPVLARAQPTMGRHIQALVFHEGHHCGQLSAWRRAHGLAPSPWVFSQT